MSTLNNLVLILDGACLTDSDVDELEHQLADGGFKVTVESGPKYLAPIVPDCENALLIDASQMLNNGHTPLDLIAGIKSISCNGNSRRKLLVATDAFRPEINYYAVTSEDFSYVHGILSRN